MSILQLLLGLLGNAAYRDISPMDNYSTACYRLEELQTKARPKSRRTPRLRRRPPSPGIRIVLLHIKGGIRIVS